ncbi:MAG: sulfatase [Candidatus Sumerlaeota bacterium]|nr:sulfatase [Candidatus Sumerlaeota bacterium]
MKTDRRTFLTVAAGFLAGGALKAEAAPSKPNFLWLIAEDTGPSAYSCYGEQKAASTPNIDRLAAEGARYTRFYDTAPVCSPSRSAFNTGMYATTIGAHNHRTRDKKPLPDGVRILSGWMRDAGYFTANLRKLPKDLGFSAKGKTDWNFRASDKSFDSDDWADLQPHQPFIAQINFGETHRSYHAPKQTDPAAVELPPYYPDHPVTREDYAKYLDSAKELDRKIGVVLAQLEKDGLADNTVVLFQGDNGESMVRGKQFCYEEGLHVPLILRWPKGLPAPAHYSPASVDDRLLESIELAPTFLSLAGAPIPPKMQGRPFLGDSVGAPKEHVFGARDRCDETVMRIRTVRDARYRYIRNFTPETPFLAPNAYKERAYPVWNLLKELHAQGQLTPAQEFLCRPRMPDEELYDLQTDPHEIHNLAESTDPEHQAELKTLRAVLEKWIEDTNDQGRIPEPAGARTDRGATAAAGESPTEGKSTAAGKTRKKRK